MKSILIGNGINIQFDGKAYANEFIMKRIKFRAKLGSYDALFGNTLTGEEIVNIFNDFAKLANDIRKNEYDEYVSDDETQYALKDFKKRYTEDVQNSHEVMLEDWFFLLHLFFLKNIDLQSERISAIQGFERLILDAIYNSGKIQELHLKMPKKVKRFFNSFDCLFTLNYDNNVESLIKREVFHLHGDYSILANSENPNTVQGYIRTQAGTTIVVKGMEHCHCNALLNYSGRLKYKIAKQFEDLLEASKGFSFQYENDSMFVRDLNALKAQKPFEYEMIMTKIRNPKLNMATNYHFSDFEKIQGELSIIGMSPNNDGHVFDLISKNKNIEKVLFYFHSEKERQFIEDTYSAELFECHSVQELWETLDCVTPTYNCKYSIPSEIDNFISCCNALSGDATTKERILAEIAATPQFEMDRLCNLVKEDMMIRNPDHKPTNEADFFKSVSSISYIALQEGVLPSTLQLICIMNFNKMKF